VRCLWVFGVAHCVSIGGFLALALAYGATVTGTPEVPPPAWALVPAIGVENFVIGLVTSGFVAFLMGVCDRRFTATQYALLTALMALGNAVARGAGGALAAALDYPMFLVAAMAAGTLRQRRVRRERLPASARQVQQRWDQQLRRQGQPALPPARRRPVAQPPERPGPVSGWRVAGQER